MKHVSRDEWGARPPSGAGNVLVSNVLGTGVHWYGGAVGGRVRVHADCAGVVRQTQAHHMQGNGWADIAYTDLVCPHGYIFEGRGRGAGSAAFGNSFHNARYYATCAIWGKGDGPAPEPLLNGIAEAVALHREWGARSDVIGHRDAVRTECPGEELYGYVQAGRFDAPSPSPSRPIKSPPVKSFTQKGISVRVIDLRKASNSRLVRGAGVKPMQRLLNVPADGMAGNQTRHALGVAQKRAGLPVDYMFGPATATALLAGK